MNDMIDSKLVWYVSEALNSQPFVLYLLILMMLDVLGGIFVSVSKKRLSSSASWRGMSKKAITLVIVGTAFVIERLINNEFPLGKGTAFLYCVTEALSILENAAAAGVPLPRGLVNVLLKLQQDSAQKSPAGTGMILKTETIIQNQPNTLSEPEQKPVTVSTKHEITPADNPPSSS